ncbi:hypothetical protein B9Z55_016526 [Caenorhabditis nigoni]|uniref:Uncharacterized protein n=1 Tax=Caenorhabditis nigoni TaxID=1611254 RepID=A0A2G5T5P6_9PELO|nr:hypothetical protein B9Z55_016526 [Caenorhabditis nigoni]
MPIESYYPSYFWAGALLAYPPLILLLDADTKCGLFYGFFLFVLTIFCVLKHVPTKVEQKENGPKLTKKQRIKLLKIELFLLLACLILQHFIGSWIFEHYHFYSSEYHSADPFYWPILCSMFALGLCSIILTFFLAEHSISLFHPSDFLDSYQMIICFIYILTITDHKVS